MLEKSLQALHQLQDENTNISDYLKTEIINKEQELDSIYEYRAKGAQIRARAEWIESGEKPTKFLGLENSRQTKKNIHTLTSSDGRTITDQADILCEQVNYYKTLYTSKIDDTVKMKNYLNSTHLSKTLSQTDMQVCEENITADECEKSLFSMKLNKSPGSDGLSVEFYQSF